MIEVLISAIVVWIGIKFDCRYQQSYIYIKLISTWNQSTVWLDRSQIQGLNKDCQEKFGLTATGLILKVPRWRTDLQLTQVTGFFITHALQRETARDKKKWFLSPGMQMRAGDTEYRIVYKYSLPPTLSVLALERIKHYFGMRTSYYSGKRLARTSVVRTLSIVINRF